MPPSTMSSRSSTAATKPIPKAPLSTVFCSDDADVVICAAGQLDFRVHKRILSLISPVFKVMFAAPDPLVKSSFLPHVEVQGSPKTWENILRTAYPMPNPTVDNLDDLELLFLVAMKYKMQPVIDLHKLSFENQAFLREDPLRLYAIACASELEDQAKYVARNAELLTVTKRSDASGLKGLTVGSYHSLVSFLAERDNEWCKTLNEARISLKYNCGCNERLKEGLYDGIRDNLMRPYLRVEDIYLKALEDRSRYTQQKCASATRCLCIYSEVREFIERMIKEREKVCDKFMREKRYIEQHPTSIYPCSLACFFQVHKCPTGGRKGGWVCDLLAKGGFLFTLALHRIL